MIDPSRETLLGSIMDGDEKTRLELVQRSLQNALGQFLIKRTVDREITVKEVHEKVIPGC